MVVKTVEFEVVVMVEYEEEVQREEELMEVKKVAGVCLGEVEVEVKKVVVKEGGKGVAREEKKVVVGTVEVLQVEVKVVAEKEEVVMEEVMVEEMVVVEKVAGV